MDHDDDNNKMIFVSIARMSGNEKILEEILMIIHNGPIGFYTKEKRVICHLRFRIYPRFVGGYR